jgi:hypothetical protein
VSLLDWDDVIDRTALGFDQLKPPGLGEIAALDRQGRPIAAADAARNRARVVALPCGRGPIVAVAGQFVQTSIDTTVGALLDGRPIPAKPCQAAPDRAARRPAGAAESAPARPSSSTVVQLVGPWGRELIDRANRIRQGRHVAFRPPRGGRPAVSGSADPGGAREHQPGLDGAHRRRHPVDARSRSTDGSRAGS